MTEDENDLHFQTSLWKMSFLSPASSPPPSSSPPNLLSPSETEMKEVETVEQNEDKVYIQGYTNHSQKTKTMIMINQEEIEHSESVPEEGLNRPDSPFEDRINHPDSVLEDRIDRPDSALENGKGSLNSALEIPVSRPDSALDLELPNAQPRISVDCQASNETVSSGIKDMIGSQTSETLSYSTGSSGSMEPGSGVWIKNDGNPYLAPPSRQSVMDSLSKFRIPGIRYSLPRFSLEKDAPDRLVSLRADALEIIEPVTNKNILEERRNQAVLKTFGALKQSGGKVVLESLVSRRRVTVQTIGRPPSRAQVEDWIRVRAALTKVRRKEDKKPSRVKQVILVRENLDDSEGSELSCSLPSSPCSSSPSSPSCSPSTTPSPRPTGTKNLTKTPHKRKPNVLNSSDITNLTSPQLEPLKENREKNSCSPDLFADSPIFNPSTRSRNPSCDTIRVNHMISPILSRPNPSQTKSMKEHESFETNDDRDEKMFEDSPILRKSQSWRTTSQPLNLSSFLNESETTPKRTPSFSRYIPDQPSPHPETNLSQKDDPETNSSEKNGLIETTPILKREMKPGKTLKRRISWNLPNSQKQRISEPILNPQSIPESDPQSLVKPGSNPESLDETESPLSKTLQDKLENSRIIRKYLTPELVKKSRSQVESPVGGVRPVLDLQGAAGADRNDHTSLLCMEVLVETRTFLLPDPLMDRITGIFYSLVRKEGNISGCIIVSPGKADLFKVTGITGVRVRYVETEETLLKHVVRLVRDSDPDILAGYEIQLESWGFLFQRAFNLGLNLCPLISRVPESIRESRMLDDSEDNPGAQYNAEHTSEINLVGRIVLNTWRIMRSELPLYSYTLQSVAWKVLGKRIPKISHQYLTKWWKNNLTRHKTVKYMLERVNIHLEILYRLDIVSRTSELARIFGIQFFEVISRGSQFRVESSMLRLAKPMNFIPVSPSRQQLAGQAAPEYLALLLEPESKMYTDPVIVLDFQSLYPSIIIGYNYCYSTCLGRVQNMGEPGVYPFGCTNLKISPGRLRLLRDQITISPGGIVFLKKTVRKGVLPSMLEDILNTRIMVKQSMKKHSKDIDLQKILHSRQLGLKLIANVTYGYTSASFSGRMPCVEVADSVVAKGREALEITIKTIEERKGWGAKVVYGDTDSVFVLLQGRTKDEAFNIGEEMARVITEMNPKPMKLKFEKVYLPCVLQTKKRYVGYMYETKTQLKPEFDAKGIETVRRDGIPATAKILEKSLRILFETKDVSQVRSYVEHQFKKIISGSLSLQDLTFAKEFRGVKGYRPTACVPALELTRIGIKKDPRAVPRAGERVPYVVVYGQPGLPLIQLVRQPWEVLKNSELRPNSHYYITKVIVPPLNRCFLLLGVDTGQWYADLPRHYKPVHQAVVKNKGVISKYFVCQSCRACDQYSTSLLCDSCRSCRDTSALLLARKLHNIQLNIQDCWRECVKCAGSTGRECISLDCSHLYRRVTALKMKDEVGPISDLLEGLNNIQQGNLES